MFPRSTQTLVPAPPGPEESGEVEGCLEVGCQRPDVLTGPCYIFYFSLGPRSLDPSHLSVVLLAYSHAILIFPYPYSPLPCHWDCGKHWALRTHRVFVRWLSNFQQLKQALHLTSGDNEFPTKKKQIPLFGAKYFEIISEIILKLPLAWMYCFMLVF